MYSTNSSVFLIILFAIIIMFTVFIDTSQIIVSLFYSQLTEYQNFSDSFSLLLPEFSISIFDIKRSDENLLLIQRLPLFYRYSCAMLSYVDIYNRLKWSKHHELELRLNLTAWHYCITTNYGALKEKKYLILYYWVIHSYLPNKILKFLIV